MQKNNVMILLLLLLGGGYIAPVYGESPKPHGDAKSTFSWKGYTWEKYTSYDPGSNNYFDSNLVFIDSSGFVHMKAHREIAKGIGPVVPAEYHASGFRTYDPLGDTGTFKFVFTFPNFITDSDSVISYSPDATGGPVAYTLSPKYIVDSDTLKIYRTYEYDIPEIYGAITDTFGHFNFYRDSTYEGADTVNVRVHKLHNTYDWDFSDPENRGNGITTAWLSVFEDSVIFSIERLVKWETSDYIYTHHVERSLVISGDSFRNDYKPDSYLYAEFFLWWTKNRSSFIRYPRGSWRGPDTLEMVIKDFTYDTTPIDPRKGDYFTERYIGPGNTATNGQSLVRNTTKSNTIIYTVKEPQNVYLNVYDMSGRLINKVSLGMKDAGQYSAKFDNTTLPNGVYFTEISGKSVLAKHKFLVIH